MDFGRWSMQVDRVESKGSIAATAAVHSSTTTTVIGALAVDRRSSPSDKVKLFRSLFRGREDVYPVRFESRKTGRAGYSPACANEWVRGVCEKPRIKCSDCPHQRWLPVTDETVTWHLSGKDAQGNPFVMGVYPMLRDERCYFLAVDFDEGTWEADALAYLETCRCLSLTAALERSRSGAGGHVWLFFNDAVPAGAARRLGSYLLTETMERRPSVGLKSYDRLFPNQDTLPRGGFGNLIALPLQQGPRQKGNSLFVDEQLRPYEDQWAFLSQLGRITSNQLEQHVVEAERRGRVVGVRFVAEEEGQASDSPWDLPPSRKRKEPPIVGTLPSSLEVVLADQIYLEKQGLPPALLNRLIRLAAFQNPEFYQAQGMRLPTYDKPRIISCAEETPSHLGLPRGCEDDLRSLMKELGVSVKTTDKRSSGNPLTAKFLGELRPEQLTAAKAMLAHDFGVLSATTAFGKTVLAAWLIAQRGVNTLILVHRQQLLEQWVERLQSFLDVPAKSIGRLGGGRKKLTGVIDVALMQSLVRKDVVDDHVADYGHLVVDECHHLSAHSFELVARRAKARYVTGLSATVVRKDGHHPIIFMQCGPVRHRVDAREQAASRPFTHHVIVRATSFQSAGPPDPDQRTEFHALYEALVASDVRNRMIVEDVLNAVQEGRSPLVLTERTDHLETMASSLRARGAIVVTLQGGMKKKELREVMEAVSKSRVGDGQILVATGKYIGEGFDHPLLDSLFLALPVSWRGIIAQYVGRLHRQSDGKREVRVYDYADLNVPMLSRMFDRRCEGYEAVGYKILLPASALPGWPVEVPLPIDPEWKRDYAASVRRLIRDGVDTTLGGLFLKAARKAESPIDSTDQARSASELFFHRRLETLLETKGAFRLNVPLPIAFDGFGRMEVDFLCSDAGLVIEVDGTQHFTDPEAYRRDRRKDALLQENGYFVLRFLAADLALHLDSILDTVLRALAHRRRRKIESE
jgi:superfamily II DNA or RNA helicase